MLYLFRGRELLEKMVLLDARDFYACTGWLLVMLVCIFREKDGSMRLCTNHYDLN